MYLYLVRINHSYFFVCLFFKKKYLVKKAQENWFLFQQYIPVQELDTVIEEYFSRDVFRSLGNIYDGALLQK